MRRVTERRLVDVLVSDLRHQFSVLREVPHYEKRIDVVAFCPNAQEITAVEAKSQNWQKALQQAILNLTAADFCYVAIWDAAIHRVELNLLSEFGIGLVSVGTRWGSVERIIEARRSPFTNRFVHAHIGERFGQEVAG